MYVRKMFGVGCWYIKKKSNQFKIKSKSNQNQIKIKSKSNQLFTLSTHCGMNECDLQTMRTVI